MPSGMFNPQGLQMYSGSYTGNDVSGHTITGLPFTPQMIMLAGRSNQSFMLFKFPSMDSSVSLELFDSIDTSTGDTELVTDCDVGNVTVGTNSFSIGAGDLNLNGMLYYFVVWG